MNPPMNAPYSCSGVQPRPWSRRQLLQSVAAGFGWMAFSGLAARAASQPTVQPSTTAPLGVRPPHFRPRAKRVIFLCMQGGPSHLDTFDYKPKLQRDAGKPGQSRGGGAQLIGSPFQFRQHGQSGLWISELFPNVARHADRLCLVRSMHTDIPNHPQAFIQLHTGSSQFIRPSMGAWVLYGLGSENENLPGFITLSPPLQFGAQNFGSAFLPAVYQGTRIGALRENNPSASLGNIENRLLTDPQQRRQIDLVQEMNHDFLQATDGHPEVEGVIQSYELAFRMQSEVPELLELKGESPATLARYGVGDSATDSFARQCLLARRLSEAGVRFIEVNHGGWDQHQNLETALRRNCRAIDRPIAALLDDLRSRGLLDDTLVIWGGEFGRTPDSRKADGRDHNSKGFTFWMAGGGSQPGLSFGSTDDYGYKAVQDPVHVHDLHATLLHLLGLDHEHLTYRYGGRDHRLTDVKGNVVHGLVQS
jgi:hypothetical protein